MRDAKLDELCEMLNKAERNASPTIQLELFKKAIMSVLGIQVNFTPTASQALRAIYRRLS